MVPTTPAPAPAPAPPPAPATTTSTNPPRASRWNKVNLGFQDHHDTNAFGTGANVHNSEYYRNDANEYYNNRYKTVDQQLTKSLNQFSETYVSQDLPQQGLPLQADAKTFYNAIFVQATRNSCPLIHIKDLADNDSCIPPNHGYDSDAIDKIGSFLYQRITNMIPSTNTIMKDIAKPYGHNANGYGLLFFIMRRTLSWMGTNRGGWCKRKWGPNMTASGYAQLVIDSAQEFKMAKTGTEKTDYKKSSELLYQAIKANHHPEVAQSLQTRIDIWRDSHSHNQREDLPPIYQIERLADIFADFYPDQTTTPPSIDSLNPTINAVQQNTAGKKKKFEYKNKVQCRACKCFGHDMTASQTCHFAAQYFYTFKFAAAEANKSAFEKNARNFADLHDKEIVGAIHVRLLLTNPAVCNNAEGFFEAAATEYNKLHGPDSEWNPPADINAVSSSSNGTSE